VSRFLIRWTGAELPVFDEEAVLEPVYSLGADGGSVSSFEFRLWTLTPDA
jgi:hypothetical protein